MLQKRMRCFQRCGCTRYRGRRCGIVFYTEIIFCLSIRDSFIGTAQLIDLTANGASCRKNILMVEMWKSFCRNSNSPIFLKNYYFFKLLLLRGVFCKYNNIHDRAVVLSHCTCSDMSPCCLSYPGCCISPV